MDIELVHLSKSFGGNMVLEDLDLCFLDGQPNCLMGASGSGKTTVANILMGFLEADSGELRGMEGRRIAAVFQEDRLIEHWDAFRNVRLVCDKGITGAQIEEEFQKVGLEDFHEKPVRLFSGGMRRRVAIVRAVLAPSDLVILDEPFKGLDDTLKRQVIGYVKDKTRDKTVILITHDPEEAGQLGGNVVRLQREINRE